MAIRLFTSHFPLLVMGHECLKIQNFIEVMRHSLVLRMKAEGKLYYSDCSCSSGLLGMPLVETVVVEWAVRRLQ